MQMTKLHHDVHLTLTTSHVECPCGLTRVGMPAPFPMVVTRAEVGGCAEVGTWRPNCGANNVSVEREWEGMREEASGVDDRVVEHNKC